MNVNKILLVKKLWKMPLNVIAESLTKLLKAVLIKLRCMYNSTGIWGIGHDLPKPSFTFVYFMQGIWPPLCSGGQSSWLQIQRSGFDSWRYQFFWEVVGLERGPLGLVSGIEMLLVKKDNSSSFLEIRKYGCGDPSRWPHGNLYLQKE
jgi:hypothetical protein